MVILKRIQADALAHIEISLKTQTLKLWRGHCVEKTYPISSALKGVGQSKGSNQTPLGKHIIRAKIGENEPLNCVFVARRPTGEIYNTELAKQFPHRDWVLTRILWLSGCEKGHNRLGSVDTMQRYIYIHGTPETEPMGKPLSHGCIRMRNQDVLALFEQVSVGTRVNIHL